MIIWDDVPLWDESRLRLIPLNPSPTTPQRGSEGDTQREREREREGESLRLQKGCALDSTVNPLAMYRAHAREN